MSLENVKRFYEILEIDPVLRKEAMSFQERYSDQDEVMNAFVNLAASQGLVFSHEDLVNHIFHHGKEVDS